MTKIANRLLVFQLLFVYNVSSIIIHFDTYYIEKLDTVGDSSVNQMACSLIHGSMDLSFTVRIRDLTAFVSVFFILAAFSAENLHTEM